MVKKVIFAVIIAVLAAMVNGAWALDLKVDLGHPQHVAATVKEGWAAWASGRWTDLYGHDSDEIHDIAGSGVDAQISCAYQHGGLKVCGLVGNLAGDASPSGTPKHDPICNSWFQMMDWPESSYGMIVLTFRNLAPGEYTLTTYHNSFHCQRVPGSDNPTKVSCENVGGNLRVMPQIYAMSVADGEGKYDYSGGTYQKIVAFAGDKTTGIESLTEAYNVEVQQVTSDDELIPSVISFRTNGAPVLVAYEQGCLGNDPVRPGRDDCRAIVNAFELVSAGAVGCACPGDMNDDGQVDLEDLQAIANILLQGGSPFVVPVEPGDCADINEDGQADLEDLQAVANILLDAGSPFIAQCD